MGRNIVFVAGMHRAGTSWLVKTLALCGLDLGERAQWAAPDNPRGFWEDRLLVALDDAILEKCGGAWDAPPSAESIAAFRLSDIGHGDEQVKDALLSDKTGAVVGFKDPRLCLTFPVLQSLFPEAVLVASRREPLDIAASLKRRNGFPEDKSLLLWRTYTDRLLSFGARFVTFPGAAKAGSDGLQALVQDLGLSWTPEAEQWFDPSLVHHGG